MNTTEEEEEGKEAREERREGKKWAFVDRSRLRNEHKWREE